MIRSPSSESPARPLTLACALGTLLLAGWPAVAQETQPVEIPERTEYVPDELAGIDVIEHLGDTLPLDLEFTDSRGKRVKLGDYFTGERPVILNLVYYRCPMLCGLVINGLLQGMEDLSWSVGQEFEIVTLSFDPRETPQLAQLNKQKALKQYGRAGAAGSWHFLTGEEKNIRALCDAVGFQYHWVESSQQYAHPTALTICTPQGKISRYLYGVVFPSGKLKLALLEAGEGKVGTTIDKVILSCFHYDADKGDYSLTATHLLRVGGVLTLLVLAAALVPRWVRDAWRRHHPDEDASSPGSDAGDGTA